MFTGIVETIGTVVSRSGERLVIQPKISFKGLRLGESVSVDGVCLTVDSKKARGICFRILSETRRVSTLGRLARGERVNLERSLRVGERLGGHLLLGHVDGQGTVAARRQKGASQTLDIQIPVDLASCLVPKGCIGIDGISLTLDPTITKGRVRVHLIPRTAKATTLGTKPIGSKVNLEVDLVAKYLFRVLH